MESNRAGKPLLLILILFTIFLWILNLYYLSLDRAPYQGDEGGHLFRALDLHYKLKDGRIKDFIITGGDYPPLAHQIAAIAFFFKISASSAVASQIIFLLILSVYVFLLGEHLWDARTAAAAAVFTLTAPFFYYNTHEFLLDIPCAAMGVAVVYYLIKCDYFRNRGYSLLAGAFLGLGMLAKWQVLAYTAGALMFIGVKSLIMITKKEEEYRKIVINQLCAFLICLLICSPYYLPNKGEFSGIFMRLSAGSSQAMGFYDFFHLFFIYVLNRPYSLMLAAGILSYLGMDGKCREKNILLFNVFTGLFIHLLMWMKDPRYLLGVVPFASFFGVYWIFRIRIKPVVYALTGILCLLAALQSAGWLFTGEESKPVYRIGVIPPRPYTTDWHLDRITDEMVKTGKGAGTVYYFIIEGDPPIKNIAFQFFHPLMKYEKKQAYEPVDESYIHNDILIRKYGLRGRQDRNLLLHIRRESGNPIAAFNAMEKTGLPAVKRSLKFFELPDDYCATIYSLQADSTE